MPEKTTEIGVKDWVRTIYDHWFEQFEENSYQAAEQVLLQLDRLGRRDLSSMREAAGELKSAAGSEAFEVVVKRGKSHLLLERGVQRRFLAVARHMLDKK
jgi:hypothetical protein